MSDYVKVDIEMEVEYPASSGVTAPELPNSAHVSYVIDTPGPKPGDPDLYDGSEVISIPATSREIVQWQGAHRKFMERVNNAHVNLQRVEALWHEAMKVWQMEIRVAVEEYEPVHAEIEARKAMVEAEDELINERNEDAKRLVDLATLEAEDAVLGPRHWVVRFKGKGKTLHTVDCRHVVRGASRNALSKPMRQDAAQKVLADDWRVMRCGTCLPDTLFVRVPQQRDNH